VSEINLPEEWCIAQLGELLDGIQTGKSVKCEERPPTGTEKGLVKISAVTWGEFNQQESKTLLDASHLLPAHKIQLGDLLISRANTLELVGASVTVKKITKDLYLSDKVLRLELGSNIKQLVAYFLKTLQARKQIESLATGNQFSMRNISQDAICSIKLPFCPLAEQQQIAQKLDELLAQVDTLKTRLDAIPKILKRFRQSVLAAAVSGRLTEGFVNLRFVDDVCSKAFDGPFGSKLKTSDYTNAGVRVARLENVGHLNFDNEKQTFISTEKAAELEGNRLKQGDVLFSSFVDEEVRVCVFKQKEAFINKADCFCLRPDSKKVSSEFLAYTLSSVTSYFQIKEQVQGVTRPRINLRILKSLSFNFPAIEEQTEIVRRVEQLFAYADQIEQRVKDAQARVNHLTQSILAKAFRGELTADWRAENPELISGENSAAALLERIRVEREVAVKPKRKLKA